MAADLTVLRAEVTRNTSVVASGVLMIRGLAAKIEAIKTDPAAIQALADELKASSDAMAAEVAANTEADPVPAPAPEPEPPAPA